MNKKSIFKDGANKYLTHPKEERGITLVALIITIVVLLILAVVTVTTMQNYGIIDNANTAGQKWNNTIEGEQGLLDSANSTLDQYLSGGTTGGIQGSGGSKVTWAKTSEGELAVGSTVKTSTNEEFYVFGIEGETVKLLAKNNLKVDGSMQDPTGASNNCQFSALANLSIRDGANLNNNATVKADKLSAVYKAMKYGETLGVTTGRLMLERETEALKSSNILKDILYGNNGKSSGTYLKYWLGSANGDAVWFVDGQRRYMSGGRLGKDYCGVRPVIEISESEITIVP